MNSPRIDVGYGIKDKKLLMQSEVLPINKIDGSSALFVTSWKRNSYGPANWKLIADFCENTLKKKPVEFSKIHCTVLDVDVGEGEKEGAATHSVTLIPATRPKSSHPAEDPPGVTWLLFPDSYYPGLGKLDNINHVIALSPDVRNTAAALQKSVFPAARFHPPPDQPAAAVFIYEAWNIDKVDLKGFHRTLVRDFCERKAAAGETLKAYSTVLDVNISDEQKKDAENCSVTLIPAQRKDKADHRDDPPKLEWLLNHEIYYPNLREVENVQYVIGYAPKTGHAAADIRRKLFPGAKLVLINHACPETNCLQAEEHGEMEFEEKMLQMASEADMLFSIGPYIHDYFENAYRAEVHDRDLSDIPHEEILPRPDACFWMKAPRKTPVTRHNILTCGQMDTQNAIEGCKSIAASIGSAAKRRKSNCSSLPEWKIQGVSEKAGKIEQKILAGASESPYVYPKLQSGHSKQSLLKSLQQSHLCLPSPCYCDYSFYGLEAMTFGLPTSVHDDSHLAHFVMKHLEVCADYCVIRNYEVNLSEKISEHLQNTPDSFKKAIAVKTALKDCKAITESLAKFASLLKEPIKKENEDDCKDQEVAKCADIKPSSYIGKSSMQSLKPVLDSVNGKMSTLPLTKDDGIGSQAVKETHGDVMDKEDAESGQAITTQSEMKHEKQNAEDAKVGNCNEEQQACLLKVTLDDEMFHKRLRALEERTQALATEIQRMEEREKNEVKTTWTECEHRLKRRVQAVLADEDSCKEVKKVCKKKLGLQPTTVTAECLGMLVKIVTLYYLYRLKQTCRSRNLAKALEPLLITDEMREIAAKVGITLQLKATYDTMKFEEIERFFIDRDGGGVQPVTFHGEIEDDGHRNVYSEDEEPSLSQQTSDQVTEQITKSNLVRESEEKVIAQHGELGQPTTAAQESQARSLLPIKPTKQQLIDSEIRYPVSAESEVQSLKSQLDMSQFKINSLQSQLKKACTEKKILETQLAEALEAKSQLEKQCQEYKQRYHSAENVALIARLNKLDPKSIEDLQNQLKEQNKVITELKTQLSQLSDAQSDIELQKKIEENHQLGEQIITSKILQKDDVYIKPKITEIGEEEQILKPEMTGRYDSEMETATQRQPEITGRDGSEMETVTPTQPFMTGRARRQMKTAIPTQPEMTARQGRQGETAIVTTATALKKEMTEPSADNVYIKHKITEIEEEETTQPEMTFMYGSEMETAPAIQPQMTGREGSEMETDTQKQPEMTVGGGSEIEADTPTQHEMTVREGSEMETATPTEPEMTVREGSEMKTPTGRQPEMTVGDGSEIEKDTQTQPEMTVRDGCEMETATPTQPEMIVRERWVDGTVIVTTATKNQKEKEESGSIFSRMVELSGGSDETGGSAVMSRSKNQQHGSVTAGSEESPSGPVSSEKKSSGHVSPGSKKEPGGLVTAGSSPVSSERKSSGHVSAGNKKDQPSLVTAGNEDLPRGAVSSEKKSNGLASVTNGTKKEQSGSEITGSKEMSSGQASSVMSSGLIVPGGTEGQSGIASDRGDGISDFESKKAIFCGKATRVSGRWLKRILIGHQGHKHKFKDVRDLAFHNDKLLVCDRGNNIVHVLNQDYTCEKELGSFSGQFAKPFKPWSIAVSQDNLYFILDKSNVQIVVCDQNNKVIRIINLPADSHPWCIALVKEFVIVTEVNAHRVMKYSKDGIYIAKFGSQGVGQTQFDHPYFVAVNSSDVIMVSDCENHCIKCFDTKFNYIYEYPQFCHGNGKLWKPQSIAVDGADNAYVCDRNNHRISVGSRDGTWGCHLFQGEVSWPRYMAVTADGDRIAVVSGFSKSWNEIVVFSK